MNWERFILVLLFYMYLPVAYCTIRSNAIGRHNLVLSVTLPRDALSDPEVLACCARFRRILTWVCLGLTAALLLCLLIPWSSVLFTACAVWLVGGIGILSGIYARGYHSLRRIKRSHGWQTEPPEQDPRAGKQQPQPPTKTRYFLFPLILSVVPLVASLAGTWEAVSQFRLFLTTILSTVFCCLCPLFHSLMFSCHGEELRGISTQKQQAHWSRIWLFFSWLTAGYSTAVWLKVNSTAWYLLLTILYTLMLLLAAVMGEFAVRAVQRRSRSFLTDQDSCWIWGQFYYNPNSAHAFVPKRMGIWMAPNFAQPAGRFFAACCAIFLLCLPCIGFWSMAEEFCHCQVTLTEDAGALKVYHVGEAYSIDTDSIYDAQLLEELPDYDRIWASEYQDLLKGSYSLEGYGNCTLCLEPDNPPFLLLRTDHGRYLFSGGNLRAVYDYLASQ